jgi:hypothetical protein
MSDKLLSWLVYVNETNWQAVVALLTYYSIIKRIMAVIDGFPQ